MAEYVFSPREFAAAMSPIKPRCQCRVCVGVRGYVSRLSQQYDAADKVTDARCQRIPTATPTPEEVK